MTLIRKQVCTCEQRLTTAKWNEVVDYVQRLEKAVGKSCMNCTGVNNCLHSRRSCRCESVICDLWTWNGERIEK